MDRRRDIVIHVFDENRNGKVVVLSRRFPFLPRGEPNITAITAILRSFSNTAKKDFYCKQHILLREMKYFSEYLNDRTARNYVDIDVHCDIEVFEWLMSYITKQRPTLEPRTAISILISSHFLQMATLEDICLMYVHDHINEIVKVPIDMNCINKALFVK
jgi:hypothetical protein